MTGVTSLVLNNQIKKSFEKIHNYFNKSLFTNELEDENIEE